MGAARGVYLGYSLPLGSDSGADSNPNCTAFESPTPANRPVPRRRHGGQFSTNSGFNNPNPNNNYDGGPTSLEFT